MMVMDKTNALRSSTAMPARMAGGTRSRDPPASQDRIRHGVARTIANLIEFKGYTVQQAGDELMHKTLKPDMGGCIILGKAGDFACSFNTDGMFRGYANSAGKLEVAIWK